MSHFHTQRLVKIRQEYQAVATAVSYVAQEWNKAHHHEIIRVSRVEISQINLAQRSLSDTYIVRAFSEFEGNLREEITSSGLKVPYKAEALINRAASMRKIPNDIRLNAHIVRAFRNAVVHQNAAAGVPLSFGAALSSLNRFVASL